MSTRWPFWYVAQRDEPGKFIVRHHPDSNCIGAIRRVAGGWEFSRTQYFRYRTVRPVLATRREAAEYLLRNYNPALCFECGELDAKYDEEGARLCERCVQGWVDAALDMRIREYVAERKTAFEAEVTAS